MRQYETVPCYLHNTSGIAVFKADRAVEVWKFQGSWCYTREGGAASILSGEPSVPGKIPGGVALGSIPGVSGIDPKRGAVCSQEDSKRYDASSYTSRAASGGGVIDILCLYQVRSLFLFIAMGESLFTPAASWWRALRWPKNAR